MLQERKKEIEEVVESKVVTIKRRKKRQMGLDRLLHKAKGKDNSIDLEEEVGVEEVVEALLLVLPLRVILLLPLLQGKA